MTRSTWKQKIKSFSASFAAFGYVFIVFEICPARKYRKHFDVRKFGSEY
jgi:hypothetical protein